MSLSTLNTTTTTEHSRLTNLMQNEIGFDQIRPQRWNNTEDDLFFYAVSLFGKDWRAISWLMGTRDLRPMRSSVQKKVKKYKGLESSKNAEERERAFLVKKLGKKIDSDDGAGVTIAGGWNKTMSKFLFGFEGQEECSLSMANAIRDVLLTRFFGRNDWSELDEDRDNSLPSRFAVWPKIFEKEEIKKDSDSEKSQPKPRKRDSKAAKKVAASTSSEQLETESEPLSAETTSEIKRQKTEDAPVSTTISTVSDCLSSNEVNFILKSSNDAPTEPDRLLELASVSAEDMIYWTEDEQKAYRRDFIKACKGYVQNGATFDAWANVLNHIVRAGNGSAFLYLRKFYTERVNTNLKAWQDFISIPSVDGMSIYELAPSEQFANWLFEQKLSSYQKEPSFMYGYTAFETDATLALPTINIDEMIVSGNTLCQSTPIQIDRLYV